VPFECSLGVAAPGALPFPAASGIIGPGYGELLHLDGRPIKPGRSWMEDEIRSINTIFWLLLAFAFSMLLVSIGAGWVFLEWSGFVGMGQMWPGLVMLGVGLLFTLGSFVGIVIWLVRTARDSVD
jgi:hypothetical protein